MDILKMENLVGFLRKNFVYLRQNAAKTNKRRNTNYTFMKKKEIKILSLFSGAESTSKCNITK